MSFSFASCGINYNKKYREATQGQLDALISTLESNTEEEDYGAKLTMDFKVLGYQIKATAYLTKHGDEIAFSAKITLIDDIESITHEMYYKKGFFYYVENISDKERNVYKQEFDSSDLLEILSYYKDLIPTGDLDVDLEEIQEEGFEIMYSKSAGVNIIKLSMDKDTLAEMTGMDINENFYLNFYCAFNNDENFLGLKSEVKVKVYFEGMPVGLVVEGSIELNPYLRKISYPSYLEKEAVEELPEWMTHLPF